MVVGVLGDPETDHHVIQEGRIGQVDALFTKIIAGVKDEFVLARPETIAVQERPGAAPVVVGQHTCNALGALAQAIQIHQHAPGRTAVRGIENMRSQCAHGKISSSSQFEYNNSMPAPDDGSTAYPRDLKGYGEQPPAADWPNGARLAVQVVLNYEEGGENCVLHGDDASECFLSEIIGADPRQDVRHMSMESVYEYGSRVGVWRLRRLFADHQLPVTVFAVGMAVERYDKPVRELAADGHEICAHGYRWVDYQYVDEDTERAHMQKAIAAIETATGKRPLGWYTGRSSPNTRRLVVEEGGFVYDADAYSDDLPFWNHDHGRPHLVIPYTLDVNDMRFATAQGFNSGEQFYNYVKDSFDVLYAEGERTPRMMSLGLHCRLSGRPGRFAALERFIRYARSFEDVWWCRRIDIARHWQDRHPPRDH